jgi:glucosamine 6-phosphate synthetase-like amidotransferase/phosphosugar isomerase protein
LEPHAAELADIDNLVIGAEGHSLYAGIYATYLLKKLRIFNTVQVKPISEISERYMPEGNPGLLSIHQEDHIYPELSGVQELKLLTHVNHSKQLNTNDDIPQLLVDPGQ